MGQIKPGTVAWRKAMHAAGAPLSMGRQGAKKAMISLYGLRGKQSELETPEIAPVTAETEEGNRDTFDDLRPASDDFSPEPEPEPEPTKGKRGHK